MNVAEITVKGRVVGKPWQYISGNTYIIFPLQLTEAVEYSEEGKEFKINNLDFILIISPFLCWVSKEHIIEITGKVNQGEGFFFIIPTKIYSNFWKFTFKKEFEEGLP